MKKTHKKTIVRGGNLNSGFESSNNLNTVDLICDKFTNTTQLKFLFIRNGDTKHQELIARLVGKSSTTNFKLPVFTNKSDIILYCILNGVIIGYIKGKNKKISEYSNNKNNNVNSNNNANALGHYIIKVEISQNCRGRNICYRMLMRYIKFIIENYKKVSQFNLINTGGIPSCRCYIKAFANNNFIGYDFSGTELSKDIKCTDANSLDFMFFKKALS